MKSFEPAPQWVLELCAKKSKYISESQNPLTDLDTDSAVKRAIDYLTGHAPRAVAFEGGNDATYKIAARLREFGLTQQTAFELISVHWNEAGKAEPPWDPEDLSKIVENAFDYATGGWGGMSGQADFEPVEIAEGGEALTLDMEWIDQFDPALIPKRAWILGNFLAQGYLTGLVAPPGVGKTTLEIMFAVALASGKPIAGLDVKKRCRVFLWNQEDELDELKRRLAAILKAFGLSFEDIHIDGRPAILLGSGAENAVMLARRGPGGKIAASKEAKHLTDLFLAHDIGAAMFDPFVELHPADENDNVEIGAVGRIFRAMAVQAKCSVLLVHHTRKPPSGESTGHVGNMDSARGAGSLVGVTRMGATLYTIDEKTADAYGVAEDERHRYVRFDDGKNNMSLAAGQPLFFRREGINIGTFEDPEEVGVLRPVTLEKRKPKQQQAAESLSRDICALLEPGASAPLTEISRQLMAVDSILYGENVYVVNRRITRQLEVGALTGFSITQGKGRTPSVLKREACSSDEQRDEQTAENACSSDKSGDE